jgi:hypothetical protein
VKPSLAQTIADVTKPLNGQYPRPWMTDVDQPERARVFIVGRNQAPGIPVTHLTHRDYVFGIDVRWGGAVGNRRANVVTKLLQDAGIRGRLTQGVDGGWEVRVDPVPGDQVAKVIDSFVW